jgi:hypothetical protein
MLLHINMDFISENPSKPCYPRAIKKNIMNELIHKELANKTISCIPFSLRSGGSEK